MWDYTTDPTPPWNVIAEADINFSLPSYTMAVFGKGNSKNRRDNAEYDDQRLQLFSQIEGLMELYVLSYAASAKTFDSFLVFIWF
jgi:hypothetical protein